MGKIISISGQKGGCGKSSITILLASMLAYKFGKKVLVIDADTHQHSISNCRADDISTVKEGKAAKEAGNSFSDRQLIEIYEAYIANRGNDLKPYDIMKSDLDAKHIVNELANASGYDFILVDMPGNVDNEDYFKVARNFDAIFVPFTVDPFVFNSNFPFVKYLHEKFLKKSNVSRLENLYWFWNRYQKDVRKQMCEKMKSILVEELPNAESMDNWIGDSNAMINPKCRNTLFTPLGKYATYGNVSSCIEEMCNKIID